MEFIATAGTSWCRQAPDTLSHGGQRVDRLLIVGVDTVLGANLAAWLANRRRVTGVTWEHGLTIEGIETIEGDFAAAPSSSWMSAEQPDWVVFCGPGAESSWSSSGSLPQREWAETAAAWARAAREWQAEFTLVSSDAVFTGPWMFHRETGSCYCGSPAARMLRGIEKATLEANPQSLIVRTNVFGWSTHPERPGLVESIIDSLSNDQPLQVDCLCHATPILATDLAEILDSARQQKLTGVYHVGGGERI
ncbi:MAG: hypothetical protein EHM42_05615, partial [Planctomycetaceae bacterium]